MQCCEILAWLIIEGTWARMTSKMFLQRIGNITPSCSGASISKSERKAGLTVFIISRWYLQTTLENQDSRHESLVACLWWKTTTWGTSSKDIGAPQSHHQPVSSPILAVFIPCPSCGYGFAHAGLRQKANVWCRRVRCATHGYALTVCFLNVTWLRRWGSRKPYILIRMGSAATWVLYFVSWYFNIVSYDVLKRHVWMKISSSTSRSVADLMRILSDGKQCEGIKVYLSHSPPLIS